MNAESEVQRRVNWVATKGLYLDGVLTHERVTKGAQTLSACMRETAPRDYERDLGVAPPDDLWEKLLAVAIAAREAWDAGSGYGRTTSGTVVESSR